MRTVLAALVASLPMAFAQPAAAQEIGVQLVAEGFAQPVYVAAPAGDDRLFVVDQPGRIWIVDDGAIPPEPFLDIGGLVSFGGERGLLGLAFHPDYANNGRFFVNYTDTDGNTRIVEYRASDDPNRADPDSAKLILAFDQPAGNHNGGWLGFGPDSYLYIATGDGGAANDRFGNGQNPDSLLAKILRIDVDRGDPYAIPPGNPWADGGGAPEAFIWGLRNPWRASFDEHNLFIADVGQGQWEEVSVVSIDAAGANLGWPIMEGDHCFESPSCADEGLVTPIYEFSHSEGCSITGGYVYRGAAIPAVAGHYFFSDYCAGFLRSFRYEGGAAVDVTEWTVGDIGRVTSFGIDNAGEIYIVAADGRIFRIVAR